MTKFKDVAGLYIGSPLYEAEFSKTYTKIVLLECAQEGITLMPFVEDMAFTPFIRNFKNLRFKPILTPISRLSIEDFREWAESYTGEVASELIDTEKFFSIYFDRRKRAYFWSKKIFYLDSLDGIQAQAHFVAFMAKKGYDLFNLIPNGEAIDVNELVRKS